MHYIQKKIYDDKCIYMEKRLIEIVQQNDDLVQLLESGAKLGIKDWYVGAGGITQSVRNCLSGRPISENIKDYDFVYYDKDIVTLGKEKELYDALMLGNNIATEVEVVNEAKVHTWYHEHFGKEIEQYASLEAAIDSWPTTATSIGVRKEGETYKIYAPYGLEDMFSMTVRPNKKLITKDVYEKKCKAWLAKWPNLTIIPW